MLYAFSFILLAIAPPMHADLEEANQALQNGQKSTSYEERKDNLNKALFFYLKLSKDKENAALNRTIADIYFQLGEYPWSILYYEKALKIAPSDAIAMDHLKMANQKLGLASIQDQKKPFFLTNILNGIASNIPLMISAVLVAFATLSLSIWLPSKFPRKWAASITLCLLLLLMNSAYVYYSTPLKGVLVLSTGFYSTPAKISLKVNNSLIFAGSKVTILQMTSNGEWLKIKNEAGSIGFIPADHLRII